MKAHEIKKGVYWVGAIDWGLRNFHGYLTQRGTTYNAYLVVDDKITLIDTVKHYLFDEMLSRIRSVVDPSRIDQIVANHVEMDHSGSLPMMLDIAPKAVVIASPNGEKGLAKHYDRKMDIRVVDNGGALNTGQYDFTFFHIPMVHWPDSMVTYLEKEKILFSNDAFGQHMATTERYVDEAGWDIVREEAAKYYANIVMPYGSQVQKALEALSQLDIGMIAPSHGLIWRSHLGDIIGLYKKWAANECGEKAVIVFDSMWGSTEKIALAIREAFDEKGVKCFFADLKTAHISDIMTHVLDSKYVFVGSPTLNGTVMPSVSSFLTYLKGLAPKGRTGLSFGSYGWGGQSVSEIEERLRSASFAMLESIKAQYVPDGSTLRGITEKVKSLLGAD